MTTQQNEENKKNQDIEQEFESMEAELQEGAENLEMAEEAEVAVEHDIIHIEKQLSSLKDALARSQADYQNLLRRVDRDKIEMTGFITANVITKILPFVDNLERALANIPESIQDDSWTEGIRSLHAGFMKTLDGFGVKSFESVGQNIDTDLHDVMSQGPGEEGIITQEFEKGYKIHDRVIRHAKVVVGNGNQ